MVDAEADVMRKLPHGSDAPGTAGTWLPGSYSSEFAQVTHSTAPPLSLVCHAFLAAHDRGRSSSRREKGCHPRFPGKVMNAGERGTRCGKLQSREEKEKAPESKLIQRLWDLAKPGRARLQGKSSGRAISGLA